MTGAVTGTAAAGAATLLRCRDARIEVEGAALLDGLEVDADGARVVLVGDWEPVFRLWAGTATLTRGCVEVLGAAPGAALRDQRLGVGRVDTPLRASSKVVQGLTDSARLLGLGQRDARRRAEATLARLGVAQLASRRVRTLDRAERHVLAIARAVVGDPPVIAIERPFAGLDDTRTLMVEAVLERAREGRRLLLNLTSPGTHGPEARAVAAADRVVVLRAGAVVPSRPAEP